MSVPRKPRVQAPPETIEPQEWQNPVVTVPAPGRTAVHPEPQAEPGIPFVPTPPPPPLEAPSMPVEQVPEPQQPAREEAPQPPVVPPMPFPHPFTPQERR